MCFHLVLMCVSTAEMHVGGNLSERLRCGCLSQVTLLITASG